jgi:hypothetical protein
MARVPSRPLDPDHILTLLADAPPRIGALTARLSPAEARTAPGEGEWSANEVLAHLRACSDVWGGCIARIVADDYPTLRAVNPRTWIKRKNYPRLDFGTSLRAFGRQRAELLAVLEKLPPEDWSRAAKVTGAGKPLERTVLFYANWLARHERRHVDQIEQIVRTLTAPGR